MRAVAPIVLFTALLVLADCGTTGTPVTGVTPSAATRLPHPSATTPSPHAAAEATGPVMTLGGLSVRVPAGWNVDGASRGSQDAYRDYPFGEAMIRLNVRPSLSGDGRSVAAGARMALQSDGTGGVSDLRVRHPVIAGDARFFRVEGVDPLSHTSFLHVGGVYRGRTYFLVITFPLAIAASARTSTVRAVLASLTTT